MWLGWVRIEMHGVEFVCSGCNHVLEGTLEYEISGSEGQRFAVGSSSMVRWTSRLRIVCTNNTCYQRDLDRNTTAGYTDMQHRHVLQELITYNIFYCERGHNPFPENALYMTADMYTQVQAQFIKRSQRKQTILAAVLYFARKPAEVANLRNCTSIASLKEKISCVPYGPTKLSTSTLTLTA